jgi:DNA-directed RNA polymerase sigma subunit (sigma70/sigma32)
MRITKFIDYLIDKAWKEGRLPSTIKIYPAILERKLSDDVVQVSSESIRHVSISRGLKVATPSEANLAVNVKEHPVVIVEELKVEEELPSDSIEQPSQPEKELPDDPVHFTKEQIRRGADPLAQMYYKDAARVYKPLEREEERQLAEQGNTQKIVLGDLKLVLKLAYAKASRRTPASELISAGNFALVKSANKFDPNRGTRLTTYAIKAIERDMRRDIRESHTVHIPLNVLENIRFYDSVVKEFSEKEIVPSESELAHRMTELKMTEKKKKKATKGG